MKRAITLAACVVVGVTLGGTLNISGQTNDPRIGRWQLNVAKSKFTGTPPKGEARLYEDRGGGIVLSTLTTTLASGEMIVRYVLYKVDGKEYAQVPRGAETTSTVTQRFVDARIIEGVVKANGKVTGTFTHTVSADGKTLTFVSKDAEGKPACCHAGPNHEPSNLPNPRT